MGTLYLRQAKLIIAPTIGNTALDLDQFHFRFWVKRGDVQTPNSLHCIVYNLGDDLANKLTQPMGCGEFTRVVLQVGYEGLPGENSAFLATIFDGNIKYVLKGNEDAKDSFVEIVAADGDSAYNFATVNISLAAGSTPSDHIDEYVKSMGEVQPDGVTAGYIPTYSTPLPRGKVMFGATKHFIRHTANTVQASWSIQDGKLQLIPDDSFIPGVAIELTSLSGLVGFPTKTQSGIEVRSLLNPLIKIGGVIHINNAKLQGFQYSLTPGGNAGLFPDNFKVDADGFYRVLWTEHTGDTRQTVWYSDMICVALDASAPNIDPTKTAVASDEQVYIP